MTTTKKINRFANYGTLEKLARRYTTLWKSYLNRSIEDRSPKAEAEAEERAKIRQQVRNLTNHNLGFEIIDSWENGSAVCFIQCYAIGELPFTLGLTTALGFKKVVIRVVKGDKDQTIYRAHQYQWECEGTGLETENTVHIKLWNKRLAD